MHEQTVGGEPFRLVAQVRIGLIPDAAREWADREHLRIGDVLWGAAGGQRPDDLDGGRLGRRGRVSGQRDRGTDDSDRDSGRDDPRTVHEADPPAAWRM